MTPPEPFNFMQIFSKFSFEMFYVTIAAIGGVARYLQVYVETGIFKWRQLAAHTFISAFSGYMFGLASTSIFGDGTFSPFLVAGIGGYMGAEATKLIEAVVKKWKK